jgi:hypothetical protein
MKIAIDYDLTFSLDPHFWRAFVELVVRHGHECRCVTIRDDRFDRTAPLVDVEQLMRVHYTRGVAKRHHMASDPDASDWVPDVWIDDKPESIVNNSPTTRDKLIEWRANRGEGPSL